MRAELDGFLASNERDLIHFRRHLHAHPELGRAEHETTALLVGRLEAAGLRPRVLSAGTGVVCDIGAGGPVVGLRADLDALPMQDEKDVAYRSTRAGICHACGHDAHTTILLGSALALAELHAAQPLPGTVRCIFQPAEELSTGALDVIADGALDGVRCVFALHCDPRLETGLVAVRTGAITGAADAVEIIVHGPGGHTARPHLTADLTYVISRVITDLPAALSRLADPRTGTSLVFGMVSAGTTANVIPSTAVARGTLRTLDRDSWDHAPKLLERLLQSVTGPFDVRAELNYRRGTPPVINDAGATALLAAAGTTQLGEGTVVDTPQSLGGEDFAWYLEHLPGSMARLGVRIQGTDLDLHAGAFDVDERAIGVGLRVLTQTGLDALDALGRHR